MEEKKETLLTGFKLALDNHSFNVSLAKHIGLTEAILLQHFYFMYCNNKENENMQKDGKTWFFRTVKSMNETYPYLTTDKIRGAIERLVKGGLVFKADYSVDKLKRATWYTISEEVINIFSSGKNETDLDKPKPFGKIPNEFGKPQQDNINKDNIKEDIIGVEPFAASCEAPTKTEKVPYKEIVDKYNNILGEKLPKVTALTDKRKKAINARVKEFGLDSIDKVFNYAYNSPFLTGTNDKNWKCNFDWIFTPSNYVKILEGNYNNGEIPDAMNDKVKFNNFIEWVKKNAPRVLQMKVKLDEHGYKSIRNECGLNLMKENLIEMSNYENLLTEFKDPVLTCVKWKEYGKK